MKLVFRQFPTRESQAFPGKKSAQRPVIPITLINPENEEHRVTLYGAIDSGSDHCMFPTSIAAVLDLKEIESGPTWVWSGVEDTPLVAYVHQIYLEIEGYRWMVNALFSHDLNHTPYGILGLDGFFDHFNVRIDYKTFEIELSVNS